MIDKDKIIEYLKAGFKPAEIARVVGCSREFICQIAIMQDIKSPDISQRILEEWKNGLTDNEIAEVTGCSLFLVRKWRFDNNYPSNTTIKLIERHDGYKELYDQGLNDRQIARSFKTYPGMIRMWRLKNHLPAHDTRGRKKQPPQ